MDLVRAGAVIIAAVGVELVRAARAALLKTAGPAWVSAADMDDLAERIAQPSSR